MKNNNIQINKIFKGSVYLPLDEVNPQIHPDSLIQNTQIVGNVIIEKYVHSVNAILRADEGSPFYIGENSNIQDFVTLHAYTTRENDHVLKENLVYVEHEDAYYSIYIGKNVSLSHGVLVHGPAYVADNTFIGFRATLDGASIGKNVEIGAHSYIKRVSIPDNVGISAGAIITTEADIEKYIIPTTGINKRIVEVNVELVKAYKNSVMAY